MKNENEMEQLEALRRLCHLIMGHRTNEMTEQYYVECANSPGINKSNEAKQSALHTRRIFLKRHDSKTT